MATLEDDLRSIQQQISQAQSKIARASVERDNASAKRASAKKVLKEEFEVETTAEAKDMLIELEATLDLKVASVRAALTEAGASV